MNSTSRLSQLLLADVASTRFTRIVQYVFVAASVIVSANSLASRIENLDDAASATSNFAV